MGVQRLITVALFALFAGMWESAAACSCGGSPSPCQSYAGASAVIIGNVKGVRPDAPGDERYEGAQTVRVQIERTFKGEVSDELTLRQPGHNCAPKFKPGDRWLMYVHFDEKGRAWEVYGCGRSGPLERTGDDLRFLNALPDSAARTRISGEIARYEDDPERGFTRVAPITGAKVRVAGEGKTYEIGTDADGVYEIYDLPPGKYSVTPELPPGLKLRFPMPFGPLAGHGEGPSLLFELGPGTCAGSDFLLNSDTLVGGKVLNADGEPLPEVCLSLMPADKVANPYFRINDCTDKDGRYELDDIPPGRYLIVVNEDGRLSGDEPFPTAYYPGVFERDRAAAVNVGEGEKRADFDIRIPSLLPTRTISGVVRYADGRPAAEALVQFKVDPAKPPHEDNNTGKADAEGRFSLKVLRDAAGSLTGLIYASEERALRCTEMRKLIAGRPKLINDVRTKPVRVAAGPSRHNVVLAFPFTDCPEKSGGN